MDLIEEYIKLTLICFSTDYEDKKSVKKHNVAVNKMYEIVDSLNKSKSSFLLNSFFELLNISESRTNVWASIHFLEKFENKNVLLEKKALNIIRIESLKNNIYSYGLKIWIDNYEKATNS